MSPAFLVAMHSGVPGEVSIRRVGVRTRAALRVSPFPPVPRKRRVRSISRLAGGCHHVIRVLLLAVLALLTLSTTACFPPPYRQPPDYPARLRQIETVTLVPPLVAVYAMTAGDIEEEVQEWSDAAYTHARVAVKAEVEKIGLTFVPFAGTHGPRPDFRLGAEYVRRSGPPDRAEESWLLFESVKEAVLRHTYVPAETFPPRMQNFDYTLGTESEALLAGGQADAFLLMIATDHIPTADRQLLIGAGLAKMAVTGSYAGPGGTPAELIVALIETKTGDLLWFNRVEMPLSDLRDPAANAALVGLAMTGMKQ